MFDATEGGVSRLINRHVVHLICRDVGKGDWGISASWSSVTDVVQDGKGQEVLNHGILIQKQSRIIEVLI